MGFFVRGVTRRNLFAIVVGAVLAGGPFIAFNLWLDNLVERQGQSEVSTAAKRAMALAEARVRDTVGTLDTLVVAGVSSCGQQDMEAMRRAAFSAIPVKEIAVIGPDGKTLCNHLGLPPGEREVVSSEPLVGAGGYRLDIISLPGGERMVRLGRDVGSAHNSISALVPTVLFLPQVSTGGGPFSGYAYRDRAGRYDRGGRRPDGRQRECKFQCRHKVEQIRF